MAYAITIFIRRLQYNVASKLRIMMTDLLYCVLVFVVYTCKDLSEMWLINRNAHSYYFYNYPCILTFTPSYLSNKHQRGICVEAFKVKKNIAFGKNTYIY